jgi:hypothetical protein
MQSLAHAGLGNKVLRQKQFAERLWLLIPIYLLPTHQVYAPIILQIKINSLTVILHISMKLCDILQPKNLMYFQLPLVTETGGNGE